MNERFTDRARTVMILANNEAQRFNHQHIGTEHLLLGLLRESDGVAGHVLLNLGVTLDLAQEEVTILLGNENSSSGGAGQRCQEWQLRRVQAKTDSPPP